MYVACAAQRRSVGLGLPESVCVPVSAINNYGAIVVFKVKEHSFAALFDPRFLAGRKFRLDLFSFVETVSRPR